MLRLSLYSVLFLCIACGITMLWQVFKTNTPSSNIDTVPITNKEVPISDVMSQMGTASLPEDTTDFFIGYTPPQDKVCLQYLLNRCLQRTSSTTKHQLPFNVHRRLLSATNEDNGGRLSVEFEHFGRQSNDAVDLLLLEVGGVGGSSATAGKSSSQESPGGSNTERNKESAQNSTKDNMQESPTIEFVDIATTRRELSAANSPLFSASGGSNLTDEQKIEKQDFDFRQNLEKRIMNATLKAARDIVLPLLLDQIVTQIWKEASTQSVEKSPQKASLTTTRQQYPFFEVEVGYLSVSDHINPSSADYSLNESDPNRAVLASSNKSEKIFQTQWLKFVQMDKISITAGDVTQPALMPCIAFIEKSEDHDIDSDSEVDLLSNDTAATRIVETGKTSVPLDANDATDDDHKLDMNNNNTAMMRQLMVWNDSDAATEAADELFSPQQLRQVDEEQESLAGNASEEKLQDFSPLKNGCDEPSVSNDRETKSQDAKGLADPLRLLRYFGKFLFFGQYPEPPTPIMTPIMTPNDPEFGRQWSLKTIGATEGWEFGTGFRRGRQEQDVVVAVIDTGCDLGHGDLHGRYWKNEGEICDNGIDDDNNGYVDDCHGYNFYGKDANLTEQKIHGTPVSGAIAAHTNNYYGIAAVCWNCRIMCIRIGVEKFKTGAFAEALNYAVGWGVRVVNYSGNGEFSRIQETAIRSAAWNDTLVVTCAGNSGCDTDSNRKCANLGYPGKLALHNIINVGASDRSGRAALYSNYGRLAVHLFAPAGDLLPSPGKQKFKTVHGTSFAAPLVSGAVALILSHYPTLSFANVKKAIVSTCRRDLDEFKGKAQCPGILDLPQALRAAGLLMAG